MTTARPAWTMAKFTDLRNGPVYIDLLQIAAVTEVLSENGMILQNIAGDKEYIFEGLPIGARVILYSGTALYTKESADTVFAEVHRARTEAAPVPEPIRVGDAPIGDKASGEIAR